MERVSTATVLFAIPASDPIASIVSTVPVPATEIGPL